jgi:asparagine synthase (glutamine-hydrolysing)
MAHAEMAFLDRGRLEGMNTAISHRGPDSDGFYLAPGIALAMRRLAIIDLSTGDQPIANEDESLWIVFNGEIYNFPDLHEKMQQRGHIFRTRTDTECILHLYEEYGDACVEHLRGMFAFALWDARRQRLLLARDRLGKKPLYYAVRDNVFYFCSEFPGLLKGLPSRPATNLESIDLYLSLQYIPDPLTAYKDVFKLPPAHRLVWQGGQVSLEQYWDFDYAPKHKAPEADLVEELRERLREAVRIRLISDVPLGAHLSGGIDSSVIVALMAEMSDRPVKTFSVGFEEQSFSELPYARAVANRYQTEHHEFTLTYGDIPATLERLAGHFGEPFADPSALPLYHLSKLTREHVTVALNGDGGDENFAGYSRYWLDPWAERYLRAPHFITRGLIPFVGRLLPDRNNLPVGRSLINGIKRLGQLTEIDRRASILRWGSYFSPAQRRELWKEEFSQKISPQNAQDYLASYYEAPTTGSLLDRTLYADLHTYLPGDLLVKADRMTMAASLEGRSPFLDHELVAWSARLPDRLKIQGRIGKHLLRKAFASYLPESIQARGKQGFGIPVGAWFRGPLFQWAQTILIGADSPLGGWFNRPVLQSLLLEHSGGREDHGKRLYALVMLALWADARNGRKHA